MTINVWNPVLGVCSFDQIDFDPVYNVLDCNFTADITLDSKHLFVISREIVYSFLPLPQSWNRQPEILQPEPD